MRTSGVLMPISSLPSPYGIGTMGKDAKNYGEALKDATNQYIKSCFKNDMNVEDEIIEIKY